MMSYIPDTAITGVIHQIVGASQSNGYDGTFNYSHFDEGAFPTLFPSSPQAAIGASAIVAHRLTTFADALPFVELSRQGVAGATVFGLSSAMLWNHDANTPGSFASACVTAMLNAYAVAGRENYQPVLTAWMNTPYNDDGIIQTAAQLRLCVVNFVSWLEAQFAAAYPTRRRALFFFVDASERWKTPVDTINKRIALRESDPTHRGGLSGTWSPVPRFRYLSSMTTRVDNAGTHPNRAAHQRFAKHYAFSLAWLAGKKPKGTWRSPYIYRAWRVSDRRVGIRVALGGSGYLHVGLKTNLRLFNTLGADILKNGGVQPTWNLVSVDRSGRSLGYSDVLLEAPAAVAFEPNPTGELYVHYHPNINVGQGQYAGTDFIDATWTQTGQTRAHEAWHESLDIEGPTYNNRFEDFTAAAGQAGGLDALEVQPSGRVRLEAQEESMALTAYGRNLVARFLNPADTVTKPAAYFLALGSIVGGSFVEISGAGYARQPLTLATDQGRLIGANTPSFGPAGTNFGSIEAAAIFDAVSGGNIIMQGPVVSPFSFNNGETRTILPGLLSFGVL